MQFWHKIVVDAAHNLAYRSADWILLVDIAFKIVVLKKAIPNTKMKKFHIVICQK